MPKAQDIPIKDTQYFCKPAGFFYIISKDIGFYSLNFNKNNLKDNSSARLLKNRIREQQ